MLVLPKIKIMTVEQEHNGTWLEDLKNLINRKQAENVALKKIQESLLSGGMVVGADDQPMDEFLAETDPEEDENQLPTNETNPQ